MKKNNKKLIRKSVYFVKEIEEYTKVRLCLLQDFREYRR